MTLEAGAPGGLTAEGETERSARITWRPLEAGNGYRVEYREADNPAVEWFGQDVFHQEGELVITNLRPDTKYEVQVGTIRERYAGNWSGKVRFRTLAPQVMACGDPTTIKAPTNTRPLATAMVGDIFQVGQFELIVTSVRGGAGRFSGTGAVLVPYLGFRLNSTFTDLRVNENKEVIDGEVIALSEGIDGWVDRWEEGEEDTGDGEGATGDADAPGEEAILEGQELRHEGEIDSVYLNSDGQIVVVDERGVETSYPPSTNEETGEKEDTRITDENGDTWIVSGQTGKVTQGSKNGGALPGEPDSNVTANLIGFDSLVYAVVIEIKEETELSLDSIRSKKTSLVKEYYTSIDEYTGGGLHFLFVGKNEAFIQEGISNTRLREPDPFTIIDMSEQDRQKLEPTVRNMLGRWLEIYKQDKTLMEYVELYELLEDEFIASPQFKEVAAQVKEQFNNNSYGSKDKDKIRKVLETMIEEKKNEL